MATINLGSIKFNWRGSYAAGTAYSVDDVVSYQGSSFVCILASTGNVPTNTTYWNVFAEGGDVATTLTTQGDILYRDASGLQRLAAGTSGQFLKTQGASANPTWGDVSSEMVKIGESSTTSATSGINFDISFNDTTYYKYLIKGWIEYDGQSSLRIRLRQGGSTITTSNYDYAIAYSYRRYSDNTANVSYGTNRDLDYARINDWDTQSAMGRPGHDFEMHFINNMQTTDENKYFHGLSSMYRSSSGNYISSNNTFNWIFKGNQNAVTGFNIYPTSGNIINAELKCYGFKK